MKCEHDDCLTCPYPDCISDDGPAGKPKKKPGRKKIDPQIKKQNAKRWQQDYYQKHKDKYSTYSKKYYREHTEQLREYNRQYRNKRMGTPGRNFKNIWMTNGTDNIRIKPEQYEEYLQKGWIRGRTLKPYKVEKEKE